MNLDRVTLRSGSPVRVALRDANARGRREGAARRPAATAAPKPGRASAVGRLPRDPARDGVSGTAGR